MSAVKTPVKPRGIKRETARVEKSAKPKRKKTAKEIYESLIGLGNDLNLPPTLSAEKWGAVVKE